MQKSILAFLIAAGAMHSAHADLLQQPGGMSHPPGEKSIISRLGDSLGEMTSRTSDLVFAALGAVGVPYRYGGNSLESGLDCSGLVREAVRAVSGKELPRRAADQAAATTKIDREELRPGDLVFFNTMRRAYSHVGIYVGDGRFVHAPRSGAKVRVESMEVSYWQSRFNGARRVSLTGPDSRSIAERASAQATDTRPSRDADFVPAFPLGGRDI